MEDFCKVRESSLMEVARMTRLTPKQRRAGLPTSTSASEREMRPCRRSPWSNGLPLSHMPLWCDRLKDKALPALRMRRIRIGLHEAHTGSELFRINESQKINHDTLGVEGCMIEDLLQPRLEGTKLDRLFRLRRPGVNRAVESY